MIFGGLITIINYAIYSPAVSPPGESFMITEDNNPMITEDGNHMLTE